MNLNFAHLFSRTGRETMQKEMLHIQSREENWIRTSISRASPVVLPLNYFHQNTTSALDYLNHHRYRYWPQPKKPHSLTQI